MFNPKIESCNYASASFDAEVNMRSVDTDATPIGNVDYTNTSMTDSLKVIIRPEDLGIELNILAPPF